jgi:Ni,Fe-hydrogenase III component G
MDEHEYNAKVKEWCSMEKRLHWTITTLLVLMGFLGGMICQTERTSKQVSTNTIKVQMLEDRLKTIENKLDKLLEERRSDNIAQIVMWR